MDKKKQEALWKKSVAASHKIWCDCKDFTSHFILPPEPEKTWPTMEEEEHGLMAAIRDLEEGGEGGGITLEEDIEIIAGGPDELPLLRSEKTPSPEKEGLSLCGVGSLWALLEASTL